MCFWSLLFFFNDTATTEIYTLSLHDALPIFERDGQGGRIEGSGLEPSLCESRGLCSFCWRPHPRLASLKRSEEHTSELQSQSNLVCRLLLEKKKTIKITRSA